MKRILFLLILFTVSAFAESSLDGVPGLIYLKNFATNQSNTADYAAGSNAVWASSPRTSGNPDTWIDANGKINVSTTANTLLYDAGYYDATGFHIQPGAHIYGTATNYLVRTDGTASSGGKWTDWNESHGTLNPPIYANNSAEDLLNISGSKTQSITYVSNAGDTNASIQLVSLITNVGEISAGDVCTASVYMKTSGLVGAKAILYIQLRDSVPNEISAITLNITNLDSNWKRFSVTGTAPTNTTTARIKIFLIELEGGDVANIEFACPQLEKSTYATPFIPTTTAATTRSGTIIRSYSSGNRNASAETCIIKFSPCSQFSKSYPGTTNRQLLASTVKYRSLIVPSGTNTLLFRPNSSDSYPVAASYTLGSEDLKENISSVVACSCSHTSPYANIYLNGVLKGSYTSSDYGDNAWGEDFGIGGVRDNNNWSDSTIQAVAIFNRKLTNAEVLKISNSNFTLNNGTALLMACD